MVAPTRKLSVQEKESTLISQFKLIMGSDQSLLPYIDQVTHYLDEINRVSPGPGAPRRSTRIFEDFYECALRLFYRSFSPTELPGAPRMKEMEFRILDDGAGLQFSRLQRERCSA